MLIATKEFTFRGRQVKRGQQIKAKLDPATRDRLISARHVTDTHRGPVKHVALRPFSGFKKNDVVTGLSLHKLAVLETEKYVTRIPDTKPGPYKIVARRKFRFQGKVYQAGDELTVENQDLEDLLVKNRYVDRVAVEEKKRAPRRKRKKRTTRKGR